jgi:hypothetical protein
MSVMVEKTSVFSVYKQVSLDELQEHEAREALFNRVRSLDWDVAREASREERRSMGKMRDGTLTYGEVPFSAMREILQTVDAIRREDLGIDSHTISDCDFVDLGSGAGRPCIAAAILHQFKSCHGVEILKDLHDLAEAARSEYEQVLESVSSSNLPPVTHTRDISLYCGSIFDLNVFNWVQLQGNGVILANSTCFSPDMFVQMASLARDTHRDNIIITFSNDLEDGVPMSQRNFEILRAQKLKMSWGYADVFYHRRKPSTSEEE